MSPAAAVVNSPEFVTVTVPKEVTPALSVNALPINERFPLSAVVPFSVVVPLPALCVKLAAVRAALAVTFFAEVMLIAPSGDVPPTTPVIEISPVPARSDKL